MAFTDNEKVKIRAHLGYLGVAQSQTYVLGVPAALPSQFMIEGAMDRVLAAAEGIARRYIAILDTIEGQMVDDLELMAVTDLGSIKVNEKEMQKLRREYLHWRGALANLLGVSPNPYDQRFAGMVGGGVNVPVGG